MTNLHPRHLTPTVTDLAAGIYKQGPSAFHQLPILGDALEELGADETLIAQCRDEQPRALVPVLWWDWPDDLKRLSDGETIDHPVSSINRWLDVEPALWKVRLMLGDWYSLMGMHVEAEAMHWLGYGKKWPGVRSWRWQSDRTLPPPPVASDIIFIEPRRAILDAGSNVHLWSAAGTRLDHETRFCAFWARLTIPQRRELWAAIGKEVTV